MSMSDLSNLGLLDLLHQGWKWLLVTTLGGGSSSESPWLSPPIS
jgi:hypothetical protein